jgi:hypothetical protein
LFKLFSLFRKCVCIHYFDWSLVSTFTNETQVSSPVTHTMWLRNSSPSLLYRSKKCQSQSHSVFRVCPWEFLEPILCKICDSLACDNLVENSVWNLWKLTWSSEIVKHRLSQIFWSTFWTRSSLSIGAQPLCSSLWTFVHPSLNILQHCLTVLSLFTLWP